MSVRTEANPVMITLLRVIHSLIALVMIASIAALYYSAATQTYGIWLWLAVGALVMEATVVAANKGDCPFSLLSKKYGDTKGFFELFLPKRIAKEMFKVNAGIIAVGCLFLVCSLVV
jgi:hypothetical protein